MDYIKDARDAEAGALNIASIQIVCGSQTVELIGAPQGERRQRDIMAVVEAGVVPYRFGQYRDLETFRVDLMTLFEETEDRNKVLSFISKISDNNVRTSEDDGISQTMTAKIGLASFAEMPVPSPVLLRPIRTFLEVAQPEGVFLFRMRKAQTGPEAALFEIQTNWQREASIRVRDYLRKVPELQGITILA